MDLLGIDDTDQNRQFLTAEPPSIWLVIQSLIVLIAPLALLILVIILIHSWRKKAKILKIK